MRRPPRSRCGACGRKNAELRTNWGAPLCGDCSAEQDLLGWVERLAEPDDLRAGPPLELLAGPAPAPTPSDVAIAWVERLPTSRPGRPDGTVAWVDREATRAWPNRRWRRALAQAGRPVTATSREQGR